MMVVKVVRRRAGGMKTGHAGTLDPLATGVLVMCLGRATKSVPKLMDLPKRYQATINLTAFSTTDDLEGELTEVTADEPPSVYQIGQVLESFTGTILQRPPAFSAINIKGQRAYKLARKGEKVEIPPRPIVIHSIDVLDYTWPVLTLDVYCGKGTYIRSLARDIGVALATGGYLSRLVRTAIGPFTIEQAIRLDDVPEPLEQADLIPIDVLDSIG